MDDFPIAPNFTTSTKTGGMIMNAIETRRSVRTYTDAPIEPAQIEAVLRAAMQAPSAKNQQPW